MARLFDPDNAGSVEVATLVKYADLVANCDAFSLLCEKPVGAQAKAKINFGPFPLAWESSGFTKRQLEEMFCVVQIHSPMQSEKIVFPDEGSFVQPRESGTFVATTRRFVREVEYAIDGTGNDIYMRFYDLICQFETEAVRKSDLAALENSNYPHPLKIRRSDGPAFGSISEKSAQGEYLWARHIVTWGQSEG